MTLIATPTYLPVVTIHQSIPIHLLTALYTLSDVCLITSSRDGMNLVAIEYMFVRSFGSGGALVISEFAGAARFFNSAQIINPWDIEKTSESILKALQQSPRNLISMKENINSLSARNWARRFLVELCPILQISLQ